MLTQPFFLKLVLFSPRLSPRGSCRFQGYIFLLETHFHFKRTPLYSNFLCLTLYAEVSHGILYAAVLHIALHQFFHLHNKHSRFVFVELLNRLCISLRIAQQSPCSLCMLGFLSSHTHSHKTRRTGWVSLPTVTLSHLWAPSIHSVVLTTSHRRDGRRETCM